jgi:hypothetical protein
MMETPSGMTLFQGLTQMCSQKEEAETAALLRARGSSMNNAPELAAGGGAGVIKALDFEAGASAPGASAAGASKKKDKKKTKLSTAGGSLAGSLWQAQEGPASSSSSSSSASNKGWGSLPAKVSEQIEEGFLLKKKRAWVQVPTNKRSSRAAAGHKPSALSAPSDSGAGMSKVDYDRMVVMDPSGKVKNLRRLSQSARAVRSRRYFILPLAPPKEK